MAGWLHVILRACADSFLHTVGSSFYSFVTPCAVRVYVWNFSGGWQVALASYDCVLIRSSILWVLSFARL